MSVDVAVFTVPGEPVSKERPRLGAGGRTYTPDKTKTAEEKIGWCFHAAVKGWKVDADSTFGVDLIFWNSTRHRRDIDNMCKTVLDGLNGLCWKDDWQVTEIQAVKHVGALEPHTYIRIYRTEGDNP